MKVFTRDYRITGDYHPLWDQYFSGMQPCVFDIETTGLSPSRSKVVLTGFLMQSDKGVTVTQFLAENHYEEAKVLEASMDFIDRMHVDYLISFNGCAFDVPFMNARLEANGFESKLMMYHFDLYRFLQKNTDLKERIGSMSQKSLENYYGILDDRGDTISGRESVMLFDQYALTGNSTVEKIILTHNREDVLHLNRLMYLALGDLQNVAKAERRAGAISFQATRSDKVSQNTKAGAAESLHDEYCSLEGNGDSVLHRVMASYGFPAAGGRLSVRPRIVRKGRGRGGAAGVRGADAGAVLRITGEQFCEPVSCAYFPDTDSPATAVFNSASRSFEIEVPINRHGDDFYMDISFLVKYPAAIDELRSDPDCINDFLILNPRTVNKVSGVLSSFFLVMN